MSYRSGDPDDVGLYLRGLEDRIKRLEARINDQSRQSARELRVRSAKRINSVMVIGDSIGQYDLCATVEGNYFVRSGRQLSRWQDQVTDNLGGLSGVTRILPMRIGPYANLPSDNRLVGTPDMVAEGSGSLIHWDYTIPGMRATRWLDQAYGVVTKLKPPADPVDILLVYLGANDWVNNVGALATATSIKQIMASYPYRYAYVLIPWSINNYSGVPSTEPWSAYVSAMQDISGNNIKVLQPVADGRTGGMTYDGIHATQAGHDAIAKAVLAGIDESDFTKPRSEKVSITGSKFGAVVENGIVVGNWRISATDNGELVATNLATNADVVLGT